MRVLYAIGLLTLALLVVAQVRKAVAHEFYNPWCCNGKDCKPYLGTVEHTRNGYYLPEFDVVIPFKDASGKTGKYAAEEGTRYDVPYDSEHTYYACIMPWEPDKVRCFYARPGGV